MIPLHFGARGKPLLGIYDAASTPKRRVGAVILNPGGWEAIRAHRTLRTLALRLSQRGVDVLRFDYTGTGDSWGDESDASVNQWLTDTEDAVDELTGVAGVTKVMLVGLRLGSTLALLASARLTSRVDRIVLWDPVDVGTLAECDNQSEQSLAVPRRIITDLKSVGSVGTDTGKHKIIVALSQGQSIPSGINITGSVKLVHGETAAPCWVEEQDFGAGAFPGEFVNEIVTAALHE